MPITVVKVGLNPKKPIQTQASQDKNGITTTTVTVHYRVVFIDKQPDPTACYGATDGTNTVPTLGDNYGSSTTISCYRILPQLVPGKGDVYDVQVDYTDAGASGETGKWNTEISFDGVPVQESYFYDLDQNQVTNSAGQNFSQQPNRVYYDTAVKVHFHASSFDETTAEGLRGQVSSADITLAISRLGYSRTFPAKTLRLDNFSATPVTTLGSLAYWDVSVNMTYRPLTTAPSNCKKPDGTSLSGDISTLEYDIICDMGYAYLDSDSGDLTPFQDKQGQNLNAPGLLDGTGGAVHANGDDYTPSPTDAHYIAFRKADEGDLSPLFVGIS